MIKLRNNITESIKNRVEGSGFSLAKVAILLGVSRPALSNLIHGKQGMSIEMAFKIQNVLALDARCLLHEQLDIKISRYIGNIGIDLLKKDTLYKCQCGHIHSNLEIKLRKGPLNCVCNRPISVIRD